MKYAWDWSVVFEQPYLAWIVSGIELTIVISLTAWAFALLLGTTLGVVGSLRDSRLRYVTATYVYIFRNIPLLLQLFIWFFVLPELLPRAAGDWLKRDLPMPALWTSIAGLALFTAARVAVQVQAGVNAIAAGQRAAALASGMTVPQVYRHVLLPQAFRVMLPPLTSEFLTIFKNSSLALTIGVFELTAQSRKIESYTFHGFEAFTAATVVYLLIALLVTASMRGLERRLTIPGSRGSLV